MTKRGKYNVKTRQELNSIYLANNDFNNLLANNSLFILKIAKSFNQPQYLKDLQQEGNIALYKAFSTFNPELGKPFLGYAKPIILNNMRGWLRINSNTVRTPIKLFKGENEIKKVISINTPFEDSDTTLADTIPQIEEKEPLFDINDVFKQLNLKEREEDYINLYFGFNNLEPIGLKEIGDKYGVSRQAVSLIINKVLKQMKLSKALEVFKKNK